MGTLIIQFIKYILIILTYLVLASLTLNIASAEAPEITEQPVSIPDIPDYKHYAYLKTVEIFGVEHWEYVDFIVRKESSWNNEAQNPNSTAFGYFQFLNSTWQTVGCTKTLDAYKQIDCGLLYIKQRYGTPKKAYQFWIANRWY